MVDFNREKMKFTEEKLEKAFIELLGNENYSHHIGISIVLQLKTLPATDLYESNKTIMRWLSD